jgi:hypothetical protein
MLFNYEQHVHTDPFSKHDHSRNFVSPTLNFLLFNNGFHAAHPIIDVLPPVISEPALPTTPVDTTPGAPGIPTAPTLPTAPVLPANPTVVLPGISLSLTETPFVPAPVFSSADQTDIETSGVAPVLSSSAGVGLSVLADDKGNAASPASLSPSAALAQLGKPAGETADAMPPAAPVEVVAETLDTVLSTSQNQRRFGSEMPEAKAFVQLSLVFLALGGFILLLRSESKPRSWTYQLTNPPI